MRSIEILFIHPNASSEIYQSLSVNHSAIETPIWAAMLANHVRMKGRGVSLLDCEANRLSIEESSKIVEEINPRIVCFVVYGQQPSASTQNMAGAVKLSKEIKKNNSDRHILFVGPHVSALPRETIENENSIDFVCQNEGVYTIDTLLEVTDLNDDSQLRKVKGLCFRSSFGIAVINEPEQIVPKSRLEIDLPGLAWDLLPPVNKYRTAGWHSWSNNSDKSPFASIYTSLGCPYKCNFCMINIINRTKLGENITSKDSNVFRWWNPEFIIKQFDIIANLGVKNVKIADELFVLNPSHFMNICDLIIDRGYDFNIWAYSRVDTCKPEHLSKLRKAGIKWLTLGIENPRSDLRKEVHKEGYKEVKISDQIKMMHNEGIHVGGNYIFGLPFDTLDSMKETLDFCFENMTEMANFYCAMAYPGSPLHLEARIRKYKLPDSYTGYSQHSYDTQNLPSSQLTSSEILKFRDEAWLKYHTDEKYISMLRQKFGEASVKSLSESTKIKLSRKLLGD